MSTSLPSDPSSSTSTPALPNHQSTQTPKLSGPTLSPGSIAPLPPHLHSDLDVAPLCRVCRSDDPSLGQLFHPCRCTGSIAHVHQDCLSTWLSHSKKTSCELCGHLFSFEKVYKPGSPARPPLTTITFQALKELFRFFLLFCRAILVGLCWLGIVPWSVVWVSTAYWKAADWFALGITSNIDQFSRSSNLSSESQSSFPSPLNSTISSDPSSLNPRPSSRINSTLSNWVTNIIPSLDLDPNSIALDIFQGQLITCAIILSFVVIFLLREWILQNTPPPDLIQEDENEQHRQHHFQPLVVHGQPQPPPQHRPIPILPVDPEDLAWSHATHFVFSDTPSQQTPPNRIILTGSEQSSIPTQVSSEDQTKSSENLEKVTSLQSSSDSTEQPVTTPGLLELADPGLRIPFYKAHDPIDSDLFTHRILVSSAFLLFVAEKSDSPPDVCGQPRSPHFGDPDAHQKKLISAWTNLAELTISHPSSDISNSVRRLRHFVLRSNCQDDQSASAIHYQELELNWTRALLSDSKISKHIQFLFNTRSTTQANQTRDQIRHKGLIYSLLSIFILAENQNVMTNENSDIIDDFETTAPSHSYERIYDVFRLFVLPLLDLPTNREEHFNMNQCQPNELGDDIYQMIQKHDPTIHFLNKNADDSLAISSISSLKDTIVKILVKQSILCTLISSPAFIRYSRGMAFDDNLFTNWRLKSTRGFASKHLHPQIGRSVTANVENDLSEISMQLINYKASTMSAKVEPSPLFKSYLHENDEALTDWIDYSTLDHKLLVTSFYLLFSGEETEADMTVPVLQNSAFIGLLEHANDQENPTAGLLHLKAWSQVVKSCTTQPLSQQLHHFKNFTLRTSGVLTEISRMHSFQKLETEWLTKLLEDPLITQFLVSILTRRTDQNSHNCHHYSSRMKEEFNCNQTLNLFLLKLVYVYIVLETIAPSTSSQTITSTKQQRGSSAMIHETGLKILEKHLIRLEETSTTKDEASQNRDQTRHKNQVLDVIRETRFLLDACRPLPPPALQIKATSSKLFSNSAVVSHVSEGDLRSELFIGRRLRKGIIGILARQKVLNMIVMDGNFSKYAHTMLAEPNLFSRIPGLAWNLQQLVGDDADKTAEFGEQTVDLAQSKQTDLISKEKALKDQRQSVRIKSSGSLQLSGTLSECSTQGQPADPPSHTDASNRDDCIGSSVPNQNKSCAFESASESSSSAPNGAVSGQLPVGDRHSQVAVPQETENNLDVVRNHEIDRAEVPAAERPLAGHLHEFVPQRAQRDAILAAGIGAGLADVFAFDDPGANGGDEELMAEDIDGILELIGMKGSLLMLAQNVGLMTMLLSLSLLAFVHLPHMMGKIAILVKAHRLLAPPFKGLLILQRYVHQMLDWLSEFLKLHLQNYQLPAKLERVLSSIEGSGQSISGFSRWLDRWPARDLLRSTRHISDQLKAMISKFVPLSTIWIKLGQQVSDQMNSIAYGSRPLDRALAVLIGYFELILMSLLYLSSGFDQQRAKFVSETLVNGLQQQLLIGKVGIFIFVELVIFPFLCGLLLNFTTIPIFANATMNNRLELYSSSPYSATLITWLVGTCFMFTFAILVSTCRESLRAGVCWWIRDPSDDRFNPIREILERSAWSQVKKISVSAVMYGAVIVCGLGSIVFNLVFFTGVLPLRIHADRPLLSSALDLVIYQTFLPLFIEWFKPRTKLKECLQAISRFMARQMRLTFYLYGERRIEEETMFEVVVRGPDGIFRPLERRAKYSPLTFFKSYHRGSSNLQNNSDKGGRSSGVIKGPLSRRRKWAGGSFARVPATDSVKVVPGRKMHIPVHVNGTPIDPADMAIIEQQQVEAREEGGGAGADQYTVVYLPPQFQARMILYVIFMWSAAITIVWQMIGIPLLVGRIFLDRFFLSEQEEPHDVYAYAIGAISCAVTYSIAQKAWEKYANMPGTCTSSESEEDEDENYVEATDEGADSERATSNRKTIFQNVNRTIKKSLHFLVLTLGGGILLPILTSILVDIYILGLVKPKRPEGDGAGLLPEIFLLEAWNYGAICLSIGARVIKLSLPEHPMSIAQDQIMAHWEAGNLDRMVEDINLKLIIPIFYKFSLMILVPFLVVQPFIMLILSKRGNDGFGFGHRQEGRNAIRWIFQSIKIISSWSRSWNRLANKTSSLTDQFNIENLEESNKPSNNATITMNDHDHQLKLIELNFLILKLTYPLILSWFSQFYLLKIFFKVFSGWLEKVRDERFLERRKLKNYEPHPSFLDQNNNLHAGSQETRAGI